MKKFLALLLALMMVLSLAACGSAPAGDAGDGTADAGTVEITDDTENVEIDIPEATFADLANGGFVVADNDQCKITITDVKEGYKYWTHKDELKENAGGFTLFVSVENKRTDNPIGFECVAASFNGLSVGNTSFFDETLSEEKNTGNSEFPCDKVIQPGETADCMITLSHYHKTETEGDMITPVMNLSDVTVISAYFEIYEKTESEDYDTSYMGEHFLVEGCLFTLYKDSKESAVYYERVPKDSDIVLYEDDFVTVTAVSANNTYNNEVKDLVFLLLFLENKANQIHTQYGSNQNIINGSLPASSVYWDLCHMIINSCGYIEKPATVYRTGEDGDSYRTFSLEEIETWEFTFGYIIEEPVQSVKQQIILTGDDLQKLYAAN